MQQQSYKNHARYYTPHHFVFYPVVLVLVILAIYGGCHDEAGHGWLWTMVGALALLTGWLSFMMRQHYGLTLQNRLVRLEMRFRYHVLTGQRFDVLEQQLSFRQIAALRFASDEELPGLVKRALDEKLSPGDIKRAIRNWVADDMRV